jgi:hypothetical protein
VAAKVARVAFHADIRFPHGLMRPRWRSWLSATDKTNETCLIAVGMRFRQRISSTSSEFKTSITAQKVRSCRQGNRFNALKVMKHVRDVSAGKMQIIVPQNNRLQVI